jgi:hypothetical protein
VGANLYRGASLFDGKALLVKPVGDRKRLTVDYHVGTHAARLTPRIMARVFRRTRSSCMVSLLAWRDASMSEERWARLVACHEVEIRLIQALLSRK